MEFSPIDISFPTIIALAPLVVFLLNRFVYWVFGIIREDILLILLRRYSIQFFEEIVEEQAKRVYVEVVFKYLADFVWILVTNIMSLIAIISYIYVRKDADGIWSPFYVLVTFCIFIHSLVFVVLFFTNRIANTLNQKKIKFFRSREYFGSTNFQRVISCVFLLLIAGKSSQMF